MNETEFKKVDRKRIVERNLAINNSDCIYEEKQ